MDEGVLRATLVTPMTGPLARYGRAGHAALRLWAERAADLPRPWQRVQLSLRDAHPDPIRAVRAAVAARPHVLFGPYGSSPAVAAAGATRQTIWNHGGATSQLAWPAFAHVVNVLAPASSYYHGALRCVRAANPSARSVCILYVDSGFARDVAHGAVARAEQLGFDVTAVACKSGRAEAAARALADADVLLIAAGFEDELAAASVALARSWQALALVGAGVDEVLQPLGLRREGLIGPAQWTAATAPEPDEGPDAAWFVARYRAAYQADPAYPAAQAFAAGLLCARCIRETGSVADAELRDAAARLRCTTLYGAFDLDPETGIQIGHEVLTVQWQDGKRQVVWPPQRAVKALAARRPQP